MDPVSGYLLASAGASAVGAAANYFGGKSQTEANIAMQRETNLQNKQMQEIAWGREDNAVSRRVSDLRSVGLSPVLATGQAAQAGSPIKMEAPRQDTNYVGEAASGAINAALGMSQLSKTKIDNQRTAAEIGKIAADTTNVMKNTDATSQNMRIQNIMTALQTGAMKAQTAGTLLENIRKQYDNNLKKMDVDKAEVVGQNPQGILGQTAATVAYPFGKIGNNKVEKIPKGAQDILRQTGGMQR